MGVPYVKMVASNDLSQHEIRGSVAARALALVCRARPFDLGRLTKGSRAVWNLGDCGQPNGPLKVARVVPKTWPQGI